MSKFQNLVNGLQKDNKSKRPKIIGHVEREINGELVSIPVYSTGGKQNETTMKASGRKGKGGNTRLGIESFSGLKEKEIRDPVVEEKIVAKATVDEELIKKSKKVKK